VYSVVKGQRKKKLLLDNHDKKGQFVLSVMQFFENIFCFVVSQRLCAKQAPLKQNKIGIIVLKNTFYKVLPVKKWER
jgi:hypothetical protein